MPYKSSPRIRGVQRCTLPKCLSIARWLAHESAAIRLILDLQSPRGVAEHDRLPLCLERPNWHRIASEMYVPQHTERRVSSTIPLARLIVYNTSSICIDTFSQTRTRQNSGSGSGCWHVTSVAHETPEFLYQRLDYHNVFGLYSLTPVEGD